jgi:hypothetical protein
MLEVPEVTIAFRFEPRVAALLEQIQLVREVRAICQEGGSLGNELRRFVNHLRRVLPGLVPGMKEWSFSEPYEDNGRYYLETFADDHWRLSESDEIALGLCVKSDPTTCAEAESPLDEDPCVYLYIPMAWPNRDKIVRQLKDRLPKGFTDCYSPGNPAEETPIWRYLRLDSFTGEQGFDANRLVREVAESFAELTAVRPIIDSFIPPKKTRPAVR